jgi:hypothetical protein
MVEEVVATVQVEAVVIRVEEVTAEAVEDTRVSYLPVCSD